MMINLNNDIPIIGNKINLNFNNVYQQYNIKSPILTSIYLDICSYILTRTIFSRSIRRYLLDANDIIDLREIASQIIYPPMSYPMKRLKSNNSIININNNNKNNNNYDDDSNNTNTSDSDDDIFTNILRYDNNHDYHHDHHLNYDYDHDQTVINEVLDRQVDIREEKIKVNGLLFPRSIMEYHKFYKNIIRLCNSYGGSDHDDHDDYDSSGRNGSDADDSSSHDGCRNNISEHNHQHYNYLPSTLMKTTLQTIANWKAEGFHIFSSIRPEIVMEQAVLSDKRWING
jgi:hypothetical protein